MLEAAGAKYGIQLNWQEFPWSCDWYKAHGRMCPEDVPDILRKFDIPCAPVLSMKELLNDKSLRASGSIVDVPHKERGSYVTVGSPIKFSDLKPEITGSPLLGEHTDEILSELGYSKTDIANMHAAKAV